MAGVHTICDRRVYDECASHVVPRLSPTLRLTLKRTECAPLGVLMCPTQPSSLSVLFPSRLPEVNWMAATWRHWKVEHNVSLVYLSTCLSVNSFIRQLVYPSTRLSVNSFICQFVYVPSRCPCIGIALEEGFLFSKCTRLPGPLNQGRLKDPARPAAAGISKLVL